MGDSVNGWVLFRKCNTKMGRSFGEPSSAVLRHAFDLMYPTWAFVTWCQVVLLTGKILSISLGLSAF